MPPDLDIDHLVDRLAERLAPLLRAADSSRLLDRRELAERISTSERTVSSMVARQELPPPLVHTSGVSRWSWPQVEQFLLARQGRQLRRGRGRRRGETTRRAGR